MPKRKARQEFTVSLVAAGSPEDCAQALKDAARFLLTRLARRPDRSGQHTSPSQGSGACEPPGSIRGAQDRLPVEAADPWPDRGPSQLR